MKPSQVLRNATKGRSLAEIMLLLEPMNQLESTRTVVMWLIDEIINHTGYSNDIKYQNQFTRNLLIALAERYEKVNR